MPLLDLPTGARLHVEEGGAGETVIALHGMLGTPRTHLAHVIDWLAGDYRIIAPTLRGYGQSEPQPRDFPHDFYARDAEDVLALMDALDIEKAHILGYSDGGEVALVCATKQPERFLSVAVWGATGYFGPAVRAAAQSFFPARWMTEADQTLHHIDNPDAFILRWIKAVRHIVDSGGDISLSAAQRITCPLLMMLGQDDALNPREYGQTFIDKAQYGKLVMFPCGHAIHDEQWDSFQRTLRAFLDAARE